jgi:hypothetical protein
MSAFRAFLVSVVVVVGVYTAIVIAHHGPNLLPDFFGDMSRMGWPGQFNLDFMFMLMLSGLWVAWRHGLSGMGVALGVGAFFLGAPYLCIYLLVAIRQARGDMRVVLLGAERAAGR